MVGLVLELLPLEVEEEVKEVDLRKEETHQSNEDLEELQQEVQASWMMRILPLTQEAKDPVARKRKAVVAAV